MIVGVLGLSVIALNLGGDMPLICFVCILIAAIGWSFSNIASKQASTQASLKVTQQRSTVSLASPTNQKNKVSALSALALVVWGGLIACVVLTISSLIFETDAWQLATFTQVPVKSWLSIGFIVYISTLIGFGLWAHLLSQNIASKVMPFALLVPVFGMEMSVLLLGEVVTWWKMLAMLLILSGLLLTNVKIGRKPQLA